MFSTLGALPVLGYALRTGKACIAPGIRLNKAVAVLAQQAGAIPQFIAVRARHRHVDTRHIGEVVVSIGERRHDFCAHDAIVAFVYWPHASNISAARQVQREVPRERISDTIV